MKKILVVLFVICCFASSAFAEVVGPLSSKDGLLVGIGYATNDRTEQDHEKVFKSEQGYVSMDYTVNGWQPYLRFGYTDLEIDSFRDSERAFGTLGLKKALYQKSKWTVGAFGQISLFQSANDQRMVRYGEIPVTIDIKIKDLKEAKVGGLVQRVIGPVEVYAGPFYNWMDGDVESVVTTPTRTSARSFKIKADDDVGGLAGVVVDLGNGFGLNLEVQQTSRTSVGSALTYRF